MSGEARPESLPTPARPRTLRLALIGAAALLAIGGGATLALREHVIRWPQPSMPAPQATAQSDAAKPPANPPPPSAKPVFDIVRVGPQGGAVIAGRAAPGAEVAIKEGDKEIGRAQADRQGDWVFTPDKPLEPGSKALTLSERKQDGQEVKGDATVFLVVPTKPDGAAPAQPAAGVPATPAPETAPRQPPALAVLTQPDAPSRILQGPAQAPPNQLALGTVDYDDKGDMHFAGSAKPGASVRVYVDNQPVGDAHADSSGRWTLVPAVPIASGAHRLRLDELAGDQVTSRQELPFTREAPQHAAALAEGNVVVQPGQSLWVISRAAYGFGVRYTVIYEANKAQIRDPNLIYPGQLFAIPSEAAGAVTPVSSSRSR